MPSGVPGEASPADPPATRSGPAAVQPPASGDGERSGASAESTVLGGLPRPAGAAGLARPNASAREAGPTHLFAREAEPTQLPLADPGALGDLVPDTVLDGARYGSLVLRTVSLRGDGARHGGEPRRDALVTARFGSGADALLLVAVSGPVPVTDAPHPSAADHRAAVDLCHSIGVTVGRSHLRLGEDIREGRRGELKSGLHRLTDRAYGSLRARATELGLDQAGYTATLRCLLLPADPACRTRVFFGVGGGGLFRLRDGTWQDLEPAAAPADHAEPPQPTAPVEPSRPADPRPADPRPAEPLRPGPSARAPVPGPGPDHRRDPDPYAESFRFRASVARPGDTLLLCSTGLAEPLRGEPAFAAALAERWASHAPPGLAAFLADVQRRVTGHVGDRTAAAVWEKEH
ncbi:protein phosphatase 2C domain-containing protein [Streptomyces sp. NPDC051776]|uniref:protein phosphatase 2C domain-containing protein n=1 Tax=Streptomyces sp. NPDC051776 TaxID=3155414 RepID=UPI003432C88C